MPEEIKKALNPEKRIPLWLKIFGFISACILLAGLINQFYFGCTLESPFAETAERKALITSSSSDSPWSEDYKEKINIAWSGEWTLVFTLDNTAVEFESTLEYSIAVNNDTVKEDKKLKISTKEPRTAIPFHVEGGDELCLVIKLPMQTWPALRATLEPPEGTPPAWLTLNARRSVLILIISGAFLLLVFFFLHARWKHNINYSKIINHLGIKDGKTEQG
ncbi:MAG: hypothetical protein ACYS8W_05060 [Planctomycetota bacterium]|jgi:hypothetical protein